MPKENRKSEGKLNWPPEKTFEYSVTDREQAIENGEYIEIPVVAYRERTGESR